MTPRRLSFYTMADLRVTRLVSAVSGYDGPAATTSTSGQVQLTAAAGGPPLQGIATVCRHIAACGLRAEQLLGSSPDQQAQVGE